MRNLVEYPITEQEISDLLFQLENDCDPDLIGDIRPVLLAQARQIVHAAYAMREGIEDRLDQENKAVLRYCIPWERAIELYRVLRGEKVYS